MELFSEDQVTILQALSTQLRKKVLVKDVGQQLFDKLKQYNFTLQSANNWIEQGNKIPVCVVCGTPLAIAIKRDKQKTPVRYCSSKCAVNDPVYKTQRAKTIVDRYGVDNAFKTREIQDKARATRLQKYGVENCGELFKDKAKQTLEDKYGSLHEAYASQREKATATNIEKYGVENCGELFKDKAKATREQNNILDPLRKQKIREKTETTNLVRYGVRAVAQNPAVKEKIQHSRTHLDMRAISQKGQITRLQARLPALIEQGERRGYTLMNPTAESMIVDGSMWLCEKHNKPFQPLDNALQRLICPLCAQEVGTSEIQKEVHAFIKSIYSREIVDRFRLDNRQEIDIFLPNEHLGIEVNGTYWHSTVHKHKNYHLNKTESASKQGIRVIHIFEYEWNTNRDKIQSYLTRTINKSTTTVYARNTQIRPVSVADAKEFLNKHHLQGYTNHTSAVGLYNCDQLVELVTYGPRVFNKQFIEIIRHCSETSTYIIGGFDKLIGFVRKQEKKSLISYVDLSKFTGSSYSKWSRVLITAPNYVYCKGSNVLTRYQCQKHKLGKLLETFDPSLSESDNMFNNGFLKVHDCGNIKFELTYEKHNTK